VKTYRCAIIGLTSIASAPVVPSLSGGRHALPYSHASALAMLPNARVVAVCDLVPALAASFQAQWGTTWPEIQTYSDYREMLAREEIDILSVCTPDDRHADIVIAAAERGIPAILCEKPLATTLRDADRMIAVIERHGTVVAVEHTRRWDPFFHRAKEIIDAGMIGEIRTIVGTLHGERAMIFRNGTHIVDLICYYAGAAPTAVFARLEEGFENFAEYRGDGGHAPESEPGASAYIEFANGVRAFYNGTKGTYTNAEWDIVGSTGRIRISGTVAELWTTEQGTGQQVARPFPASMVMKGAIQGAFEELIGVLEGRGQLRSTPRAARQTVEILVAMLASQQQGNRLVQLPLGEAGTAPYIPHCGGGL
jgi:predicted dehydrogenase